MDKGYYRKFSQYLKERFGGKVYRICLDAGFTCPNRDGTAGWGGCAYCSERGSWNPSGNRESLKVQVHREIERVTRRYRARKYIAYFQAYTNTYAPVETLRKLYDSVISDNKDIVGLAIGTRPDCIDREKLELIASFRSRGLEVWIEYGLQSAHDATLKRIGRGHTVGQFKDAVIETARYDIQVYAHVILGLPGENKDYMINTAQFLAGLPVSGIKIHNLNIVEGTRMAEWYRKGKVAPLRLEEYADCVVDFLERTDPEVVIARLVADSDPDFLIEPKWSLDKPTALGKIVNRFKERESYQGRLFQRG